jgi:hypothetical protein
MLQPVSRSAKGQILGRVVPAHFVHRPGRPKVFVRESVRAHGFPLRSQWTPRVRRAPVESIDNPAEVVPTADGYEVPGFARIVARPHRGPYEARQLAQRVACRPLTYLPFVLVMPGVTDLRPTFGKAVARG